jgi:excisionase family DNA binding protein
MTELMTPKQVAALLSVSVRSIWQMERDGSMPKAVRLSRNVVRWDAAEIRSWIEAKKADALGLWLEAAEVARMLGVSRSYVRVLAREGGLPPPVWRNRKVVRWDRAEVLAWVEEKRASSRDEARRSLARRKEAAGARGARGA